MDRRGVYRRGAAALAAAMLLVLAAGCGAEEKGSGDVEYGKKTENHGK